jgi:protein-S-isoprenylcysteine O-methyltransferase Ste14
MSDDCARPGDNEMNLNVKAWLSLLLLAAVMGLLLFLPAGTIRYWQAWLYLSAFTVASLLTTLYLMRKDPALLARRLSGGPTAEKRPAQKLIMLFTSAGFVGLLVIPAFERRFGRADVPPGLVIVGELLVAAGFYLIFLVYRENTYTSATIEIARGQKVVDTGPYAVVRHPMYAGALLYLGGTPLGLGSYRGLLAFAAVVPFLIWRLLDEEKYLTGELPGYREYRRRVRHRLVPFVW